MILCFCALLFTYSLFELQFFQSNLNYVFKINLSSTKVNQVMLILLDISYLDISEFQISSLNFISFKQNFFFEL